MSTPPVCTCGKASVKATGDEVYPHRLDLGEKRFWVCWDCDARVGCHPGTWNALGTLANKELRAIRQRVHAVFDPFWTSPRKHRSKRRLATYKRLADDLGIPMAECHVSHFDIARCEAALEAIAKWDAPEAANA